MPGCIDRQPGRPPSKQSRSMLTGSGNQRHAPAMVRPHSSAGLPQKNCSFQRMKMCCCSSPSWSEASCAAASNAAPAAREDGLSELHHGPQPMSDVCSS